MPENENGQGQQQAQHAAFQSPPAANGASLIQIPAEEWHRLRSLEPTLAEFQRKSQADIDAKEQERLKAIGDKDGVQRLLDESNKSWQSKLDAANGSIAKTREKYHGKALESALAGSLAGVQFVGENAEVQGRVAANFRSIIQGRFEVREDEGGNLEVRDKVSGRPAADVMKELLNAPEHQGFFAPKTRGGAGTDGSGSAGNQADPNANPHPFNSVAWHGWNVSRGRANLTGLQIRKN